MQGDYFHEVRHRIAGDATEFRRKQKVNLWELSQRSRHSRGGEPPNISVTNYFLEHRSRQICCFHFQSQLFTDDKVSVSKSTNLSGFTENHRCIRFFFLVNLLFDFIINSNWLSWLMTRPGCEKQQKNGPNAHWKKRLPLHSIHLEICVSCQMFHYVIGHFWALLGLFPPS